MSNDKSQVRYSVINHTTNVTQGPCYSTEMALEAVRRIVTEAHHQWVIVRLPEQNVGVGTEVLGGTGPADIPTCWSE